MRGLSICWPMACSMSADLLFTRIHGEVEQIFGLDSMLLPASLLKSEANAKTEIEVYQVVESVFDAAASHYVADKELYLNWLGRLRLAMQSIRPESSSGLHHIAAARPTIAGGYFPASCRRVHPEAGRRRW